MPSLSDAQNAFLRALQGKGTFELETLAVPPKSDSISSRIAIYQDAYLIRITESLLEDFPRTARLLGVDEFSSHIPDFLRHSPSRYASLAEVSGDFPGYLASRGLLSVSELARWEWLHVKASWRSGSSLSPIGVAISLHPSSEFFESRFDPTHDALTETPFYAWVAAPIEDSIYVRLPARAVPVVKSLFRGDEVGNACSGFSDEDAPLLQEWFNEWASKGMIRLCLSEPIAP